MRHGGFKTEAELGTAVQGWLSQSGWDVYPEVTAGGGDERADLVAVCGPLLWVVECKMHLGLDVLAQAHRWHGRAHYVSVATPPKRSDGFARLLDEHPNGLPVKAAIEAIKSQHHYRSDSTARAAMMKWTRAGVVSGVRLDESTTPARFVRETAKT